MPATIVKSKTDNVKLTNISSVAQTFGHDGQSFFIQPGKFLTVTRERAEHGIKKCFSMSTGKHSLKIEELPEGQRTAEGMSRVASELEAEKAAHAETKSQVESLLNENKKLRDENEKPSKRR